MKARKLDIIYTCLFDIVFKFESEYGMNIFDDDHERNNQEAGHCHDREDETGASQEQNTDKEEFDFGKCQGIFASYLLNELCT